MKKLLLLIPAMLLGAVLSLTAASSFSLTASDLPATDPIQNWHAHSLLQAIGNVLLFAAIGIATAIIGYKVFDKCTPGDLHKEILEHKNIAAAIVAAAVIIGVSIIIAASMLG
jgi:putative membrane protein